MSYQVEIKWNREFHFVRFGAPFNSKHDAVAKAKSLLDMGDGARVKAARVINTKNKHRVW